MSLSRPNPTRPGPRGFTLVEMLVVMVILGLLLALLLPAVQRARESARTTSCANNLRQLALAVANYEVENHQYPSSAKWTVPDASGQVNPWSAQALLLPHIEQGTLYKMLDFDQSYQLAQVTDATTADGRTRKLSSLRIPTYLCPSEQRDTARIENGAVLHYPINYGMNLGTWFVYDPQTGRGGDGAFTPFSQGKTGGFPDGLSYTLCAAEVKAWQPYYRNAALAGPLAIPDAPVDLCAAGGTFKADTGHTEWVDGRVHQTGFTTTFRPNAKVLCQINGQTYDVDWTNQQEGKSNLVPTYAAVTARSYHVGGVNTAMMDGSVRWFANEVNLGVWRAYSTRAGEELIPSDAK